MAQRIELHILQDEQDPGMAYVSIFQDTDEEEGNAAEGIRDHMLFAMQTESDEVKHLGEGH